MSLKIASSRWALTAGILFLSFVSLMGYLFLPYVTHGSIYLIYAYIALNGAGIIGFDLWRRKVPLKDRHAQYAFKKTWRKAGFWWHAVGAVIVVIAAIWSAFKPSLVELGDHYNNHFASFAINAFLLAATPTIASSAFTQAVVHFQLKRLAVQMSKYRLKTTTLTFAASSLVGLIVVFTPMASYAAVLNGGDPAPPPYWAVLVGAVMGALKIYLFIAPEQKVVKQAS
ncbi:MULTISPECIES: hypothetical protein [unclassified Rhizobium]|uniref:hypothetical protein n=1 Tax=unclassified Rhizobium TaxID=2613769 RepID=UPI001C838931|nr:MULTISPECIES: hypothetical protein [unclassified Rhizobium]MBX5166778.1 hypothetical protein [Rhizobium sp. NZLR4b]MBX5186316.1 hypothetical protein [Rhizobium sp. NZLR5]